MEELRGTEHEKGLPFSAYMSDDYFSSFQWEAFRFQIKAVRELLDQGTVLEIGRGSGVVNAVLNATGLKAESLDINENLNPTYVGDISRADYVPPKLYDCVLCAEVLEHIPFEHFDTCLANIRKSTKKYAVITLPTCRRKMFYIELGAGSHVKRIPFGAIRIPISTSHFWEINSDKYCSYKEVLSHIERFFTVKDRGVILKCQYHNYYILEAKQLT